MSTRHPDQSSQEHFPPPPALGIGRATELETVPVCSRVIPVADGHVISTESRPDYRDGNMMFLSRPPSTDDRWDERVQLAFEQHDVPHVQLRWEAAVGAETVDLGPAFEQNANRVLMRDPQQRNPVAPSFVPLTTDSDLDELAELSAVIGLENEYPADFVRWQAGEVTDRVKQDRATWFGVRDADQLVATAGLVRTSAGLRFQDVQTHPTARRRGWATRLLQSMLETHRDEGEPFVIVAEADSVAERLYRSLGFHPTSELHTAVAKQERRR